MLRAPSDRRYFPPLDAFSREIAHLLAPFHIPHFVSFDTRGVFCGSVRGFLTYCSALSGVYYRREAAFSRSRLRGESWTSIRRSMIVKNRMRNLVQKAERMPDNGDVKGKSGWSAESEVREKIQKKSVVLPQTAGANTAYFALASTGRAKAGAGTCIKIAMPFPRAADNIFAGSGFYRRVLPAREGSAERTREGGGEEAGKSARRG